MLKHGKCLQDGKFIAKFYIQHTHDATFDWTSEWYWLEYHKSDRVKRLSEQYYLLPPTGISLKQASYKNLVPYCEFVNITDPAILIHGPFEFAKLNGRKTRDRIDIIDWNILRSEHTKFDDSPPIFRNNLVSINFESDYIQECQSNPISSMITAFLGNLEIEDKMLREYDTLHHTWYSIIIFWLDVKMNIKSVIYNRNCDWNTNLLTTKMDMKYPYFCFF